MKYRDVAIICACVLVITTGLSHIAYRVGSAEAENRLYRASLVKCVPKTQDQILPAPVSPSKGEKK